jgi:hypothetical protein
MQRQQILDCHFLRECTVNVDFLRIEYMVLAKYQHMSILELILLVKQHVLILCKNLLGVAVLIIVNKIIAISHTITQSIVAQDQFKQPMLSS